MVVYTESTINEQDMQENLLSLLNFS